MSKYNIDKILEEKYQEEFAIIKETTGWLTDKVRFQAAPVSGESIVFTGTYSKKTKRLNDDYRSAFYGRKATQWLQKELVKYYDFFAASSSIRCAWKGGKLSPLFTFLKEERNDNDFRGKVYFFTDLDDSNHQEVLGGIQQICTELHKIGLNNVVFDLSFFSPELKEEMNIENTKFGFNVVKEGDAENDPNFMEKINTRILFKIPPTASVPDTKAILDAKSENPENPRSHIFE